MTTDSDNETSLGEAMRSLLQEKTVLDTSNVPSMDLVAEGDLKLWLQHTGFFDIEHRQKVLSALRQLKALDEQRQKIISEIQNTTPYIVPPSTPALSPGVYSPSPFSAQRPSQLALDRLGDYNNLSRYHVAATQSAGELCGSEPCLLNKGFDSESAYSAFGNGSLASQQHEVPTRGSSVKHLKRTGGDAVASLGDADSEGQGEQSPSKRSSVAEASDTNAWPVDEDAQPSTPKQGARYFLVKSFNSMNVDMSQRDGLWITKAKNGPMLSFAFNQCKNVYLIFSINKSKAFQGYRISQARMTTAPDLDIAPAKWMSNISWQTSYPFRIEWLNTRRTEFWTLGDLKNAFNDNAPVFVGRDGQEYPEDCGRKILEMLDHSSEERGGDSPWATLASPRSHAKSSKTEALSWRREESPDSEDAVPTNTGSEPAAEMPLIDY
ncbi:YTH domain-containing protein 1 [Trichoderma asperellum]|uniref:YTH domain-containing protein 1 n=1 Tax=Trichoderma asperellum TaxID=101201 RepID=A0A6V8QJZ2_TRIAP|nr:YTH domain-containing protein 1 [Trichoderma asperellum]